MDHYFWSELHVSSIDFGAIQTKKLWSILINNVFIVVIHWRAINRVYVNARGTGGKEPKPVKAGCTPLNSVQTGGNLPL